MAFAYHGNWCGPGWSAGQWKDAIDLTEEDFMVPAKDPLDEACKNHDINIARGNPRANEIFLEETKGLGIKANLARTLVDKYGPSPDLIIAEWKKKNFWRHPNPAYLAWVQEHFMQSFDRTGEDADISQEYEEEKENDEWDPNFITPDRMASQPHRISPNEQVLSVENLPSESQVERPLNPDLSLQEWAELMSNKRPRTGTSFYNLPPW